MTATMPSCLAFDLRRRAEDVSVILVELECCLCNIEHDACADQSDACEARQCSGHLIAVQGREVSQS